MSCLETGLQPFLKGQFISFKQGELLPRTRMGDRLPHQNKVTHGFLLPKTFPLQSRGGKMDFKILLHKIM